MSPFRAISTFLIFYSLIRSAMAFEFGENCTDDDDLKCHVKQDDCGIPTAPYESSSQPYDIRLNQLMVTVPSRIPDPFQLRVNLSWKIHHASLNRTQGFRIKFVDRSLKTRICFLYVLRDEYVPFDFKMKHWFHFWIHDWFRFGTPYFVSISTIPRHSIEANATNVLASSKQMSFTTPEHPETSDADSSNCSYSAHQDASRWIGAFRDVIVWPWANKLVAVFVAAPPKYCFEAYRLRLNRFNMIEKEVVVTTSSLISEQLGNTSIQYGNYTFENVTPGVYSLLLVPLDKSFKYRNRCLCPLPTKICSCSHAQWSGIEIKDGHLKFTNPCANGVDNDRQSCQNRTGVDGSIIIEPPHVVDTWVKSGWVVLILLLAAAFMITASACCLRIAYIKYTRSDIILYTIPLRRDNESAEENFALHAEDNTLLLIDPSLASSDIRKIKVLVIFSHDNAYHTKAVKSLINFTESYFQKANLANVVFCADFLSKNEIAENKIDWMAKNLFEAQKILLVNSCGAYLQYEAKINGTGYNLDENNDNDLFLPLLDLLTENCTKNEKNFASKMSMVNFPYTNDEYALKHVLGSTGRRFRIPEHLDLLIDWLNFDPAVDRNKTIFDYNTRKEKISLDKCCKSYLDLLNAIEDVERNNLISYDALLSNSDGGSTKSYQEEETQSLIDRKSAKSVASSSNGSVAAATITTANYTVDSGIAMKFFAAAETIIQNGEVKKKLSNSDDEKSLGETRFTSSATPTTDGVDHRVTVPPPQMAMCDSADSGICSDFSQRELSTPSPPGSLGSPVKKSLMVVGNNMLRQEVQ